MSKYQVMPRLTGDEYAELERSIVTLGVQVPVVQDEDGNIVDGHHRKEIAERLGVPYDVTIRRGSNAEMRQLAFELNLHRRHLTREQRREAIAKSLLADPQLSDRQHAERTGASPSTVGSVRTGLEEDGMVSNLDTRIGRDGVAQPATKPTPSESVGYPPTEPTDSDPTPPHGNPRPIPNAPDPERVEEWEDEVESRRPKPAPTLTAEEQRQRDLEESDARTARYVQAAISHWSALYRLRTNDRREQILAHLPDSDLAYLAEIERCLK